MGKPSINGPLAMLNNQRVTVIAGGKSRCFLCSSRDSASPQCLLQTQTSDDVTFHLARKWKMGSSWKKMSNLFAEMNVSINYPLVSSHAFLAGKSTVNEGFNGKITYKQCIFQHAMFENWRVSLARCGLVVPKQFQNAYLYQGYDIKLYQIV